MASKKANFDEASSGPTKEDVQECDPMTGTGKHLSREISSKKSVAQRRQFSVKIGDEKALMVRGDFYSNVLSALSSRADIYNRMKKEKKKNNVPYLIGKTGIEGCINLGMPLRCLPENSETEMKFYKHKAKTTDEYHRADAGQEDWILFYVCPIAKRSDTKAGKSQKIIKCVEFENDCFMCVFAPEGETIKDALCKDGRFLPLLEKRNWELIGKKSWDNCFDVDRNLRKKKFTVGLKKCQKGTEGEEHEEQNIQISRDHEEQNIPLESAGMHEQDPRPKSQAKPCSSEEQAPLISNKIYLKDLPTALEHQYSDLKEQCKIINNSFEGAKDKKEFLALRKKEFDKVTKNSKLIKIQRKLIGRSESVGYIIWDTPGKEGSATCFVLCSTYILTCFHVVQSIVGEETDKNQMANKISDSASVIFSYEDRLPNASDSFSLEPWLEIANGELDYAVLKLKEKKNIPKGLVHLSSPPPFNGPIYIIGHPDGKAKSMDGCSVVSIMQRQGNCEWRLAQREECSDSNRSLKCVHLYTPRSFPERPEKVTYDTNFFGGSSGSPMFDQNGQLVALHAGGYEYGSQNKKRSIIEFGFTISSILQNIKTKNKVWYDSEIVPFLKDGTRRESSVHSVGAARGWPLASQPVTSLTAGDPRPPEDSPLDAGPHGRQPVATRNGRKSNPKRHLPFQGTFLEGKHAEHPVPRLNERWSAFCTRTTVQVAAHPVDGWDHLQHAPLHSRDGAGGCPAPSAPREQSHTPFKEWDQSGQKLAHFGVHSGARPNAPFPPYAARNTGCPEDGRQCQWAGKAAARSFPYPQREGLGRARAMPRWIDHRKGEYLSGVVYPGLEVAHDWPVFGRAPWGN